MSEPYKVSILVPVYGVERYIERCACSIFEQTYHNLEIIFVDDCTPDKSIEIVKRMLEEYPERKKQTRIVKHEKNRGLAAARNTAVAAATGQFLFHLDSDDWIEKDTIQLCVNKQVETKADIVSVDSVVNDATINPDLIEPVYKDKNDMLLHLVSTGCNHAIHGRLIRLSLYIDNHLSCKEGFDMAEDWYMTPRLVYYARKLVWIRRGLYHYVINSNSYTYSKKTIEQEIASKYQDYVNQCSLWEFFKDKDESLCRASKAFTIRNCFNLMQMSIAVKDKSFFHRLHHHLLKNYSVETQIGSIGIKIAVVLHLPFSYYILLLRQKL